MDRTFYRTRIDGLLSFIVRQHYGLMNQDRIIRLELRLRYLSAYP
jgi:hypothetical protein